MLFLSYFRHPFPSREGFSAYRMPGPSVHFPLILMAAMTGLFLCLPHPYLRPLLLVWLLAGIYLGRDYTIYCHYAPPLTLLAWAGFFGFLIFAAKVRFFGLNHPWLSAVRSLALLVLQVFIAWRSTREEGDKEGHGADSN